MSNKVEHVNFEQSRRDNSGTRLYVVEQGRKMPQVLLLGHVGAVSSRAVHGSPAQKLQPRAIEPQISRNKRGRFGPMKKWICSVASSRGAWAKKRHIVCSTL